MARTSNPARTTQVAIVALPPVSMSGVGPIVDALNLANEIDGRALYRVQVCSWDGRAVPLSGGAQWPADAAFGDAIACDWLIIVSERFQQFADYRLFLASLSRVGQRTPLVTGIHHGVWWLAMAGQLSGYRVSVNWETYQQFSEQFERSIVTQQIFEIDRDRATCAGGQATVDFMLAMIGRDHGPELADRIADTLGVGVLRAGEERQRIPFVTAPGERHPRLNDALMLMEANIEDPLTTDDIAGLVGVSRRQLERLFRQYLARCRPNTIWACDFRKRARNCSAPANRWCRSAWLADSRRRRTFRMLTANALVSHHARIVATGSISRRARAAPRPVSRDRPR